MIDILSSHAGLIGLLLFFSIFVFIIMWAFNPVKKHTIESYKYIPFSEDSHDLR